MRRAAIATIAFLILGAGVAAAETGWTPGGIGGSGHSGSSSTTVPAHRGGGGPTTTAPFRLVTVGESFVCMGKGRPDAWGLVTYREYPDGHREFVSKDCSTPAPTTPTTSATPTGPAASDIWSSAEATVGRPTIVTKPNGRTLTRLETDIEAEAPAPASFTLPAFGVTVTAKPIAYHWTILRADGTTESSSVTKAPATTATFSSSGNYTIRLEVEWSADVNGSPFPTTKDFASPALPIVVMEARGTLS